MELSNKYTAHYSQQLQQYQIFLESLKLQSNFGCIITQKIASIIQHYFQISTQWEKKQKDLKTFYLYNTKLVQTLSKFGQHQKKILDKLHSLQQLNNKIIKQYCFKNNKSFKLDQIYKPIEPIFQAYQISKWKIDIPNPIEKQIDPSYHQKIFQFFNQYLLPKQDKLKVIIQKKLRLKNQLMKNPNLTESLIEIKQKLEKYAHKRQLVNKDSMFDLYTLKKQIIQQSQSLQLIDQNDKKLQLIQQREFFNQIMAFHSKIQKIQPKQLIEIVRRQKERQKGIKKSRNRQIAEIQLIFQKLMDQNLDLKAQTEKISKQIIENEKQIHKLRTSLKEKQVELQYKSMKKGLSKMNSINSVNFLNEETVQQMNHLKQANLKFLKQVQDLKNEKLQIKQQLKLVNLKLLKSTEDYNKQKIKLQKQNEELKNNLASQKNRLQSLKLTKLRNESIQAFLLPIPSPILLSPIIKNQIPINLIAQLRKKLELNNYILCDQQISTQDLFLKCLQFIENQPSKSDVDILQTQFLQKDKILIQKQIQFKEVQRQVWIAKTEIVKLQKEKEQLVNITNEAVTRMNKSQDLACQATNVILETALKGPQAVIKMIQANLEEIKNLLRIQDHFIIQSPPKFKRSSNAERNFKINYEVQNNQDKQSLDSGNHFTFHKQSYSKQMRDSQFQFNNRQKKQFLRDNNFEDQRYQTERDSYHVSKKNIQFKGDKIRNQQSPSCGNKTQQNASVTNISPQISMKATLPPKIKKQNYLKKGNSNSYHQRKSSTNFELHQSQRFNQFAESKKQIKNLKQSLNMENSYGNYKQLQNQQKQIILNIQKTPRKVNFQLNKKENEQRDNEIEKKVNLQEEKKQKLIKKIQSQKQKKIKQQKKQEKYQDQKDLIDSSHFSVIPNNRQQNLRVNGNQSIEDIFVQSSLQKQSNIKLQSYQNNILTSKKIENKKHVTNADDLNPKNDSNIHIHSVQNQEKSMKNLKPKYPAHLSQQILSGRYDISNRQIQLKSEQEYEALKKKYLQLLKKKNQLDQKIKSRALQSDQNEIQGFVQKMKQLEKAYQKSQNTIKQNNFKYQNFLRDLQDSGARGSKQKMQNKLFFLEKRIRQLQKIIKNQKQQFQRQVVTQIKKSEKVAEQIFKQFQKQQIEEQSKRSLYRQESQQY